MWKKFVAGGISGLIGAGFANPADLIKSRMQAMPPNEYFPISWHVKNIYRNNGGLLGFYTGVRPTMIRAVLLNGSKLGSYDTIKHVIIDKKLLEDGRICLFVASVWAGLFMTIVTSPVDNIRTRIMN